MEKQKADAIITEYLPKIFGFAVKKSFYYDEAEELAADITAEVYRSLLEMKEIYNIEGYVWRISEHVYAKYVSRKKKHEGVSIDDLDLPDETEFYDGEAEEEISLLRREIGFLTKKRRAIIYAFYYQNKTIQTISGEMGIPEGTVKWHLNKAKNDLKEGYHMKRMIGKLGLDPVEAVEIGHHGSIGDKGGPGYYLDDKLNLNIVYSVYFTPRTKAEIAEELGMTLVFIEDRIDYLEANGFLVKTAGDKYTTYVRFNPRTYSRENYDKVKRKQREAAEILVRDYVPKVRAAIADVSDVYIPDGNRELLEASVIYYAIENKCRLESGKCGLEKYRILTTDGGDYGVTVDLKATCVDPEYEMAVKGDYWSCGGMHRCSDKYHINAWSVDNQFTSRKGTWKENLTSDYDVLYEYMTSAIEENEANAEKFDRLKRQGLIWNGKVNAIVVKDEKRGLFAKIPALDDETKFMFANFALENAMAMAKEYPVQMQDLVMAKHVGGFIENTVAIMVLNVLYANGTFKPLGDKEKFAINRIVFADVLPQF